jgi:protoporphyrinogen oxidase
VPQYGESVWCKQRFSAYPFGLAIRPKYAASALWSRVRSLRGSRPETAADWFRSEFGAALADEIALPLLEAWSGMPATQLAAAVGDKMPSSIARTLYLRLMSKLSGRTVAIGYCRTLQENPAVVHVYPTGGIAAMCQKMADTIADCIQLESPVEAIYTEGGAAVGVRVAGTDYEADAVISTAPVHILARLVEGSDALAELAGFRYRPMVFVNLLLSGRGLLPDVVIWTPEARYPFFRATETPLSMPWMAPDGKTSITLDLGASMGDAVWKMQDEQLGAYCLESFEELVPDVRDRYLGCRVLRTPLAYPVFDIRYEARRQAFARSTGVRNLFSVGRNGEFDHILMEDVYWRTRYRLHELVAQGR